MDPLRLIVAVLGIALLVVLVWSDWRVRSARSFAILGLALAFMVVSAVTGWLPAPLAWAIPAGLVVPIMFHPRWLAPLEPSDLAMVERLMSIERALVRASEGYRKGQLEAPDLHEKFHQIRRRAARLEAPDEEWERVVGVMLAEIDKTKVVAAGQERRSSQAVKEDRRRFRSIYRGLVDSRLRFWR